MIWYGVFFGDHHRMNAWFGIPAHAEAGAVEPEAAEVAPQVVEQAEQAAEGETHSEAAPATEARREAAAGHGEAHVAGPIGAVFFGPDNHVIDERTRRRPGSRRRPSSPC